MEFLDMKRPTIADLAKAAGVSVSTVNRVLYEPEFVREHTRTRYWPPLKRSDFTG